MTGHIRRQGADGFPEKTELVRGEVLFTYRLAGRELHTGCTGREPGLHGDVVRGEVTAACGERVELAFDMDGASAGETATALPLQRET